MKILITGIAGGIGSTLGYQLFLNNHEIFGVDNFQNGYQENLSIDGRSYCKFYQCDIKNRLQFLNICQQVKPDAIVHLAATTALPVCESLAFDAINNNVGGTANVLECARLSDIGLVIFASTSAIYENTDVSLAPFKEHHPINPRLIYPLSKKLGEELCLSYEQNYGMTIPKLRFFNVFGPRQDIHRTSPPLINYLVRELVHGRRPVLHSTGLQVRDYIHVDDVTNLIELVLSNPIKDSTINVCSGTLLSVIDIVNNVKIALSTDIEPIFQDSTKFWNNYKTLFQGKYKLDSAIVDKEVNKFALGDNSKAILDYNWRPNLDLNALIQRTAKEIKEKL
jgi:UDP-glucose 4-epimerase